MMCSLCNAHGNVLLPETIASGNRRGRVRLSEEIVDGIQEAVNVVGVVVANGEEDDRDSGGKTNSVFDVQILITCSMSDIP